MWLQNSCSSHCSLSLSLELDSTHPQESCVFDFGEYSYSSSNKMETFWNTLVSLTFCAFALMRTVFLMEVTVHPRGLIKTMLLLLAIPPQRLRGGIAIAWSILPKTVSQSSEDHSSTDLQNKKDAFTSSTHWSVPRRSQWVCFLMQEANFPRQLPEVLPVSCGCAICLWCLFRQIREETWKDLASSWLAFFLTSSPGQHLLDCIYEISHSEGTCHQSPDS